MKRRIQTAIFSLFVSADAYFVLSRVGVRPFVFVRMCSFKCLCVERLYACCVIICVVCCVLC